jgi:hypothetical protein
VENEKVDRYVSFQNINCFERAFEVMRVAKRVLANPAYHNPFWQQFLDKTPPSYESGEEDEDLLYHICANLFYLEELFEAAEDKEGLALLDTAEYDCC